MNFFKTLLASVLGVFIALGTLLLGLILIIWMASSDKVEVDEGSVLLMKLRSPISEFGKKNPFGNVDLPLAPDNNSVGLFDILKALKNAKADDRIKGIYLDAKYTQAGFATMTEVRNALLDFKESGKFIYAYGDFMSEGAYFLASVADSVFINPKGAIEMNGLATERTYYRQMFDQFGIKPEIFRVGTYKSAVEPYLVDSMSVAARFQTKTYLDSLNNFYMRQVAKSRNISFEELSHVSNQMLARDAQSAVKYKIADVAGYRDEAESALKARIGKEEDEKIKWISLTEYMEAEPVIEEPESDNKIAIIVGDGTIVQGKGGNDAVGGDRIAKEIKRAREDEDVKAIVLRINSPGGDALASDIMWREVMLTKGKKPIIASMSDVAASGGYYMAMACDTIVAMPNTITGSIGVFATLFDVTEALDKVGVTFSEVTTGEFSNLGSPTSNFSEGERRILQEGVNQVYSDFTSKAAEGRKMDVEKLKEYASGRVWVGGSAKEIGLVDVLGDFQDAVSIAAKSANLSDGDYQLKFYKPKSEGFFEELMGGVTADVKQQAIREELGDLYPLYKQLQSLKQIKGVQALMPFEVVLR